MVLNLMIQKSCGEGNVVILVGFWVSGAVVEKLGNYFDITTPYPFPHIYLPIRSMVHPRLKLRNRLSGREPLDWVSSVGMGKLQPR